MLRRFFERYQKIIVWIMVIGFFLGAVAFAALRYFGQGTSGGTQNETSVAIMVNEDKITQSQFNDAYQQYIDRQKQLYSQYGRDFSKILEGASGALYKLRIKTNAADSLIRETILKQQAKKRKISVKDSQVEQQFNSWLNSRLEQQGWTLDQLKAAVNSQEGLTYDKWVQSVKDSIRQQKKFDKLKDAEIGSIEPSKDDLQNYLQNNRSQYVQTPARARAMKIVVDTQSEAKQLRSQIVNTKTTFEEMAKEKMKNPDTGWFQKGEKSGLIDQAAFSMKPGQISNPIYTQDGWALLKVTGKKAEQVPPFSQIKSKLKEDYIKSEKQKRFDKWYKNVRDKASIAVKLPVVKARMEQEKSRAKGLEAFQDLKQQGYDQDPYLSYYMGKIYMDKKDELQQKLNNTAQTDSQQLDKSKLKSKIQTYEEKALTNFINVLENGKTMDKDLLQKILSLDPDNARANYYLAGVYRSNNKYAQAVEKYKQAIKSNPEHISAYVSYGNMLVEMKNYKKAAKQYKQALQLSPENTTIHNKLARAYLKAEQYAKAKEHYQQVLNSSPENFTALSGMGDLFKAQQKYKQAIEYYNDALLQQNDTKTQLRLARCYLKTDQLEEAKSEFEAITTANPYNASAYLGLGKVYAQRGNEDTALSKYREGLNRAQSTELRIDLAKHILQLAPKNLEVRFTLARAYRNSHIYNSAIEQYKKIVKLNPSSSQKQSAYQGLAKSYMNSTEYKQAEKFYQKGLQVANTPTEKTPFYEGIIKAEENRYGKGQLNEPALNALLQLAQINYNQGKTNQAKTRLNRIQDINPEFHSGQVSSLLNKIQPGSTTTQPQTNSEAVQTAQG